MSNNINDTKKWISVFNEKFIEFIKDLIDTFPNDKDFKLCKQSFSLLEMVDDRKPVEMFRLYAMKYRDKIMREEEDFFLTHDFKFELESNNDTNFSIDLLIKLKKSWKSLNAQNKEVIWSYFKVLYKVNDKICI
tara:strand:- start:5 stop:406 length:402 start_codon:yes stop_codon:yes gene_type:complete